MFQAQFWKMLMCTLRPNIPEMQLRAVREDLPLEEKQMVMNES